MTAILKNPKFLVHVRPLADRFRNRFLHWLREKISSKTVFTGRSGK